LYAAKPREHDNVDQFDKVPSADSPITMTRLVDEKPARS